MARSGSLGEVVAGTAAAALVIWAISRLLPETEEERIKKFVILPTEWTVDSEELTPTLKLKRRVIHQKYADEISALYEG